MDGPSFEQLLLSHARAYSRVADTFRALKSDGRIELVDFSSILRANSGLLDRMLEHDMAALDQWVAPLRESLAMWRRFLDVSMQVRRDERGQPLIFHDYEPVRSISPTRAEWEPVYDVLHRATGAAYDLSDMVEVALGSSKKRRHKEYRSVLRDVIRTYLRYVNARLSVSSPWHFQNWTSRILLSF